ncbi:MAG: phosphoribosyl-ATP pyrophosphohydrolase [Heyndrickxia sp.]
MKKIIYHKLVRDNIPKIIESNGESCECHQLDEQTYSVELKNKLTEEVKEYLSSKNDVESIEELADILEIMHALAKIHHQSFEDIENVRHMKHMERGGFEKRYFLVSTIQD